MKNNFDIIIFSPIWTNWFMKKTPSIMPPRLYIWGRFYIRGYSIRFRVSKMSKYPRAKSLPRPELALLQQSPMRHNTHHLVFALRTSFGSFLIQFQKCQLPPTSNQYFFRAPRHILPPWVVRLLPVTDGPSASIFCSRPPGRWDLVGNFITSKTRLLLYLPVQRRPSK